MKRNPACRLRRARCRHEKSPTGILKIGGAWNLRGLQLEVVSSRKGPAVSCGDVIVS